MMKKLTLQTLGASSLAAIGVAIAAVSMKVEAQLSPDPLSGTCGIVINLNTPAEVITKFAQGSLDQNEALNALGVLNFTNKTAKLIINDIDVAYTDDSRTIIDVVTPGTQKFDTTLSYTPSSDIPNAQVVSIENGDKDIQFNLLPVNSNGTYLIQGITFGSTGVCQKV